MTSRIARTLHVLARPALAACAAAALALPALAETPIRAIGYTSNLYLWGMEEAFYNGPFKEAGAGLVSLEAVPHDLAGLRGPELLALLQDGTLQVSVQNLSYMAGEDPRFEALDLAGVTLTNADAKKATDAYRDVIARVLDEKFNIHLLGIAPLPSQVFWCRDEVSSLADLGGKKIRVFNATLSDFVAGLDSTTVTMPFVEVIPALQRGVADCAVTGTSSGNTARWFEVTKSIYPMNVGWSMVFWAANKDAWDGFSPVVQAFLTEQYATLEAAAWTAQIEQDTDALSCSSGGECRLGIPASISVATISEDDAARSTELVRSHVLPNWAARCGADCVAEWNATVGAAIGIEAPLP